ncbi:hypothetical protein L7F22_060253 [Adiantum nelumboides]|nr:hypothetical protein [Adiantum nelumboides]
MSDLARKIHSAVKPSKPFISSAPQKGIVKKEKELASPTKSISKLPTIVGKVSSSKATVKTTMKFELDKKGKKVYELPGQKHDPPEERDPLRIFYESLYHQNPKNKRHEEGSSSHGTERVSHDEDALFKAQLVSFMETFQQLSKHPTMQELLQASKSPTQTQKASSQSLQSPRQSRSGHLQRKETSKEQRSNDTKGKGHVVEQPSASIGHRQPSTHGLVNGQDSNEQTMRQTIPLPMSNVGCFGGGSVFQAMIKPSPALHGFMPDNAYGAMPLGNSNPMYGNIGVQPGFQCAVGSYGMPGANMGMAGFSQPDAQNLNMAGRLGVNYGLGMPLLNAPAYDNLTPKGKPKDYKEGGEAVKFDTWHT